MKSEIKMPRDRDREVKCHKNSREFSRNETLAGYWIMVMLFKTLNSQSISSYHQRQPHGLILPTIDSCACKSLNENGLNPRVLASNIM